MPVTVTVTVPSPVVQVPENVGVVFDDGVATAFKVTTGAVVSTPKLTVELDPMLPAASVCDPTAEYEPSPSDATTTTENAPTTHGTVRDWVPAPEIPMLTGPSAVPQVPVSVGVVFDDGVATEFSVTLGAVVSTTNATEELEPVFVAASVWDATAEKDPSPSAGAAPTEKRPLLHAAVRVWTDAPVIATLTRPSPVVQVPAKVGVVLDDGVVSAPSVTTGAVVSTVKETAVVDDELVAESDCDATTE